MMPSTREIVTSVYGAWLLLRFDARGLGFFEDSVPAFWRSFFAAVIVAPGHAILVAVHHGELERSAGPFDVLVIEALSYVILWTAFPVVLYQLAHALGRAERYVITVVAVNWSGVIQIAISLPAHALVASGVLPSAFAGLLSLAIFAVVTVYEWFIVRTALTVSPLAAAGVVFLDIVLSFMIRLLTDSALV